MKGKKLENDNLLSLMLEKKLSNYVIYCSTLLSRSDDKIFIDQHPIRLKMSKIIWEDRLATIVLFTEDLNALELKHLQQREIYKDRVLATISHELRSPLNGIIGMISNVLESITDEKIKNW
jgi:signal transduction histidine kinase